MVTIKWKGQGQMDITIKMQIRMYAFWKKKLVLESVTSIGVYLSMVTSVGFVWYEPTIDRLFY